MGFRFSALELEGLDKASEKDGLLIAKPPYLLLERFDEVAIPDIGKNGIQTVRG